MPLELDHCFILVSPGAPEAARLIELGLIEGPGNRHPGQGSANRRFFFADGMLELLWLHDPVEARRGPGRDLRLVERAGDPPASPFGLILRDDGPTDSAPPFDGWTYQPDYFEPPQAFHVGANSADLREPLCIFAPFRLPPPAIEPARVNRELRIERVRVTTLATPGSAVLARLEAVERLEIVYGQPHLLELGLAGAGSRAPVDLRPALPLRLHWESGNSRATSIAPRAGRP